MPRGQEAELFTSINTLSTLKKILQINLFHLASSYKNYIYANAKRIKCRKHIDHLVANFKNNLYFVELAEKSTQLSGTEMFSIIQTVH